MKIEKRKIADLHPHPRNYRKHSEQQLLLIEASLEAHGQQRPVVIEDDGTILAGHAVVLAAERREWEEVDCHVYDGPHPEQFLIVDNRSAELGHDNRTELAELLVEVRDDAVKLSAAGYSRADVEKLVASVNITVPDSDATEPPSDDRLISCPKCGHTWEKGT